MARLTDVRLTALGKEQDLIAFEQASWQRALRAQHVELYEFSGGRRVWWYQTHSKTPYDLVRSVSSRFPALTIFLDYEDGASGVKGLAKAIAGRVEHCRFCYAPRTMD